MTTEIIDLSKSKPISAVEAMDFQEEAARIKGDFLALDPEYDSLSDLDPAMVLIHAVAMEVMRYKQFVNESARAATLAFSRGVNVDALTALFNVGRTLIDAGDVNTNRAPVWESDDELKKRFLLKLESISGAGPRGAYEFHALSAYPMVKSINAVSPQPSEVSVAVLSREGDGTPSAEIVTAVADALNSEDVRPITDRLTVVGAQVTLYQIDVLITVKRGVDESVIATQSHEALQAFADEAHRVGKSVYRDRVASISGTYRIQDEGTGVWSYQLSDNIVTVVVHSPALDVITSASQAPYCTDIVISTEVV